ncbi:MAG: class I SAM-dependent methyltransferase [Williamsia sp.]|nr:class I SAM-dependent methyltransferase [Williamsia sp.]
MAPSYIPALRYNWLTRFYDFFLSLTFPERKIKQRLISQLKLQGNENILDFGVGTATLSLMIKTQYPTVQITGIDVDEKILSIARQKADNTIQLLRYDGSTLPFETGSFDVVVSSLVFHHLPTDVKKTVLNELHQVLKRTGILHIADFGKPASVYARLAFGIFRRFDGEENTRVNARGALPSFLEKAGFVSVKEPAHFNTAFGTVRVISAGK